MTEELSMYCSSKPKLQKAWDNTSLELFRTCPRKYQLQILEGWIPKAPRSALIFGIWVHECMELYWTLRSENKDHKEALRLTVRRAMEISYQVDLGDREKTRDRFRLIQTIVWYLYQHHKDSCKTAISAEGKPAVELSFAFALPILSPDGDHYLYCGHIDRVVEYAGEVFVLDYKTTTSTLNQRYFAKYSPNGQLTGYIIAANSLMRERVKGAIIDAMQVAKSFSRFARGQTDRTNAQLSEFIQSVEFWITMAERCVEINYWPTNEASCDKYGGCEFRDICNKDPAVRQQFLEANFNQEFWNPLDNRGA